MAVFGVEFTSNGSAKVESEINAILRGAKATSSEIVALSKTLNTSAQSASAFAAKLGLSTGAANEVVNKFKALRQSGLDNANTFKLLQNETGITAAQYKNLVLTLKDADAQSARYNQRLKDQVKAQEATKEASDAQLIALQEVNRAAQQVARALNAFTGQAVGAFIEYEDALTTLRAKANPTAEQMKDLEAAILDVALVTSQTPASAAKAATSFISLGAGADGAAQNLKTAAQLTDAFRGDFTVAAKVVQLGATIFSDFGETAQSVGDKISYISDTSAVGSSTGLQEFLQLFSKSAPLAKTLGINLDELIASFAVLRDAGQAPEVAATSLKSLLSTIIDNKQKFSELGVEVFDANGKFVGLAETFKRIAQAAPSASAGVKLTNSELAELATQATQSGLSIEQVNDIFGKIGVSSALTLAGSYEVVAQKTEAVGDQMGTLAEKSAIINSSIQGQMNLLKGSFESALVDIGKSLSRVTAPAVAGMLELINVFLAAPPVVKDFVGVTIGVTTAAVGVVAALTGYGLALKALEAAKVRTTLKTIAATAANTANAISAVSAGVANQGLAKSLGIVAVASIKAAEGITAAAVSAGKTALAFAPLLLALGGVVASAKLVQASIDSSTSANRAKSAIDALNKSLEDYRKATGQVVPDAEKTKSKFDELKDGAKDLASDLWLAALNFKLFGLGSSAAEAGANSLAVATGDLQPVLNGLNSEFFRLKQGGELGSESAKKLIPTLEAAKVAIGALQAEGVKNNEVGADQLLVWRQQLSDLDDLINEIKGAATATTKLNEETEESIKTYEELANALANTMGGIETDLLNAQRDAYAEFGDNKEALDQRLFELDQASLERRLAAQQKFLADINTATFESEDEKQSKILEAKQSVAELELEINKKSSDRLLEQQEEARKIQEKAEKEAIERRSALRQAELDKDLQNIEIAKKAAELAAQARIDAENQVLEALDDQSTAINNQLALLEIQQSNESAVSAAQIARYDRQIEDLGKVAGYLDIVNDKESSLVEKQLAKNELQRIGIQQHADLNNLTFTAQDRQNVINTLLQVGIDRRNEEITLQDLIVFNEEKRRQVAVKALEDRQAGERAVLELQQQQERIELQRQVSQAKIAEIEAQSLITQTQLAIKGEERLLAFKKLELAAAQAEGAAKSELIALQGQVDAQNTALQLAQSELPLAREQANLAGQQLADAREAVIAGENLFQAQTKQLTTSQDLERKALETANHGERLATALGDSTEGATGTADGLERAADAAERTADALANAKASLASMESQEERAIDKALASAKERIKKLEDEKGRSLTQSEKELILSQEQRPLTGTGTRSTTGLGTQYFVDGKEVSKEEYEANKSRQSAARKSTRTIRSRVGLNPVDDSYAALKDTIQGLEDFEKNTENIYKSAGIAPWNMPESTVGKQLEILKTQLRDFFSDYRAQSEQLTDEQIAQEITKVEAARDAARKKAMSDNSQRTKDEVTEFNRKWDILTQINTDRLTEQRQQEAAAARARAEEEAAIRREVIQIEGDKLTADQIKAEKDLLEFRIANEQSLKGWELDRVNARLEALKQVEATLTRINELERLQGAVVTAGGIVSIPGRASGGPVSANRPYIVGEKGPELIVPKQSGTVITNDKLKKLQAIENSLKSYLNIALFGDPEMRFEKGFLSDLQREALLHVTNDYQFGTTDSIERQDKAKALEKSGIDVRVIGSREDPQELVNLINNVNEDFVRFLRDSEKSFHGLKDAFAAYRTIIPISNPGVKSIPGRASGGTLRKGQTALVGEEGAEIVYDHSGNAAIVGLGGPQLYTPGANTEVIPAPETKRILSREGARLRSLAGGTFLGGASFDASGNLIPREESVTTGGALLPSVSAPATAILVTDTAELRRQYEEAQQIREDAAREEQELQDTIAANREAAAQQEREALLRSRQLEQEREEARRVATSQQLAQIELQKTAISGAADAERLAAFKIKEALIAVTDAREDSNRVLEDSLSYLENQYAQQLITEDEFNKQRLEAQQKSLDELIKIKKDESELYAEGSDEQRQSLIELRDLETQRINLIREYRVAQLQKAIDDSNKVIRESFEAQAELIDRTQAIKDLDTERTLLLGNQRIQQLERELGYLDEAESLLTRIRNKELNKKQIALAQNRLKQLGISLDTNAAALALKRIELSEQQITSDRESFELQQEAERGQLQVALELERIGLRRQAIEAEIALIQSRNALVLSKQSGDTESIKVAQESVDAAGELSQNVSDALTFFEQTSAKQIENLLLTQQLADAQRDAADEAERFALALQKAGIGKGIGKIALPGRASGGPVSAGQPYIVGERRPELFVPRVPGTIVPRVPKMNGFSANLSKVESLLTQLVNRPVPTVNAPATFINQPNPLQTQIELLQGQLRAARGAF